MIAGWPPLFLYNGGLASVVAVAQLVESQIVILVVVGSSPIGHPTEPPSLAAFTASFQSCANRLVICSAIQS
jgi:hypothetical protein